MWLTELCIVGLPPPEDVASYLVVNFAAAFRVAKGGENFQRTRLRDPDAGITEGWNGAAVGVSYQIPLVTRETCFSPALFYLIR